MENAAIMVILVTSLVCITVVLLTSSFIGIEVGILCPRWNFSNVSITPCKYHELTMIMKYSQSDSVVQLPDEYYLIAVVRDDTPAPCLLRGNSTPNISYTLQTITSVEEGPLCSPEQRPDCLLSTQVNYNNSEYFGVSVWNQKDHSVHYLIVTENTKLIFQTTLIGKSFNLQDLWYNALNCEARLVAVITLASLLAVALPCCVLTVIGLGCFLGNVPLNKYKLPAEVYETGLR